MIKEKLNAFYYPKDKVVLPSVVMVEPTNACNLKCSMCYVQQQTKGSDYLSIPNLQTIMAQLPKIRELIFCGIGEPLLNKDLFKMIKIAKAGGINFINLVTNGKLLNEVVARNIVDSGINRIQISVHSFNPKNFAAIRNEDEIGLEELNRNIKRFIVMRNEAGVHLKVCCNAVVNKFNYNDLIDFIREAKALGVDRVEFIQMTTADDNLRDINAPLEHMASICDKIRKYARKINIEASFLNGNEYGRCYQLWDFIMIHANGDISPCNGIFPTEKIALGNILTSPLEEIWHSEKYQGLRSQVRRGKLTNCCYCESGYRMEGLNYRWFKNYYMRPLKRIVKNFIRNDRFYKTK